MVNCPRPQLQRDHTSSGVTMRPLEVVIPWFAAFLASIGQSFFAPIRTNAILTGLSPLFRHACRVPFCTTMS